MSELNACSTMLEEKQKWSQKKKPCLRIFRVVQMSKSEQFFSCTANICNLFILF